MRNLLLGAAAIALSGCSWLGGNSQHSNHSSYNHNNGYYAGQSNDGCCVGGKTLSRWNLEGAIGPEFFVGGDALTGNKVNSAEAVIAANPGLNSITTNSLSMDDAYDPGMRYELGGSYALNPNRKVTLMGSYAQADGEEVNLGSLNGNAVTGDISDYERYGVEVGLRQYFTPTKAPLFKSIRPYVEGKAGAAHIDDIAINNAQLGGNAYNNGTIGLYESGWVPTAAGMVGFEAPVFNRATLGLETGIRYTGTLKSDTSDLGVSAPFGGINNGSQSWTVPVALRGRYRF